MVTEKPPATATSQTPARSKADYIKIIALTLGLFASVMSTTILSILSPKIIEHFAIDYSTWQTRNILFFSLFAGSMILMGKISDRLNPFYQLYTGISCFILTCVGSVVAALLHNWWLFLLFQGIQAICDACMAPCVITLIRRSFKDEQLGWAFGCFSATMASGSIAGAGAGGFFTDGLGGHLAWYHALSMLGLIATASFVMVRKVVPVDTSLGGGKLATKEWLAVGTTACLAVAIFFAQTLTGMSDWSYGHGLVLGALALVALLESYTARHGLSLIPWELFRNFHYSSASIRIFLGGIFVNVALLVFPLAFQQLYGISAAQVAVLMVTSSVMVMALGPVGGRIADWNLIFSLSAGLGLALLALLIISGIWVKVDLTVAYVFYFIYGLASALSSPSQMKLISIAIDKAKVGQGMGFYHFMQFTSGAFAAGAIGSLFVNSDDVLTHAAWQDAIMVCFGLTLLRVAIISFDLVKLWRHQRAVQA